MKTKIVLLFMLCASFVNAQMFASVSTSDTATKTSSLEGITSWQAVMRSNPEMSPAFKKEVLPFLEDDSTVVEQDQIFFAEEVSLISAIKNVDPEPFSTSELGGIYLYKTGEENQIQIKTKNKEVKKYLLIRARFDHKQDRWKLNCEDIIIRTLLSKNSYIIFPKVNPSTHLHK